MAAVHNTSNGPVQPVPRVKDQILQKQLDFLGSAFGTVVESARLLKFDATYLPQVLAVALHGSMVEFAAACLSLFKSGDTIGITVLMRSMYEALVDQSNLLVDADYAKNMESANLRQMERLLTGAKDDKSTLLRELAEKWDVPKELQQLRERLDQLRNEGRFDLSIFERSKRAGLEPEYRSVYVLLCLEAHGNISALVERHVETGGDRVQLAFFKEPDANSMHARIDAITAMLLSSADMIHQAFKSGCTVVKPLQGAHAKLRKELFGFEIPAALAVQ